MLTLFCLILLYFLPAIIGRDKRDAAGIFLLNLFLGWTVIGWVIALIWACTAETYPTVRMVPVAGGRTILLPVRDGDVSWSAFLHGLRPHGVTLCASNPSGLPRSKNRGAGTSED